MKIFITGSTGFIGKFLLKALLNQKDELITLVRDEKKAKKLEKEKVKVILGNLDEKNTLQKTLIGIDLVFHLAAIRNDWGYSWEEYYRTNVLGTKNLLKAAYKNKVKHFIFVSSVKAAHPSTPYGKSKFLAEKEVLKYFKKGLPVTIIRPAIVYGPNDHFSGMMPKLLRLIKKGLFLIVGTGENRVHLVYIDDLIKALLLASQKSGFGKIFIIASEKPIKLKDLTSLIANQFKVKLLPFKVPLFLANITGLILEKLFKNFNIEPVVTRNKVKTITADEVYDIALAQKELNFVSKINYKDGLKKTIEWYVRWN